MTHSLASDLNSASRLVQLLIADESPMNCQLLERALRRSRFVKVVAHAVSSDDVLLQVRNKKPNLALISSNLQDGSLTGFAVVRELRTLHSELRTIMLLASPEKGWVIDAFRAGAKGVFCRKDSLQYLAKCIQCVHSGQIWANSEQLESVLGAFARVAPPRLGDTGGKPKLTKREQEVAEMVAGGLSNREIAFQLGLSAHTVKNYMFHIFEKLGISSRLELVLYARAFEPPPPASVS